MNCYVCGAVAVGVVSDNGLIDTQEKYMALCKIHYNKWGKE